MNPRTKLDATSSDTYDKGSRAVDNVFDLVIDLSIEAEEEIEHWRRYSVKSRAFCTTSVLMLGRAHELTFLFNGTLRHGISEYLLSQLCW